MAEQKLKFNNLIFDLLSELANLEISVRVENNQLKINSPDGALTPELTRRLVESKQQIIEYLSFAEKKSVIENKLDFSSPEFNGCPYDVYKILRLDGGVYRSHLGPWVISRYDDVRDALLNPLLGNAPAPYSWVHQKNSNKNLASRVANNILPFMDGNHHILHRKLVAKTFFTHLSRVDLNLQEIAKEIIAPFLKIGKFDLIADIGRPYASVAIARLLGLPEVDHSRLAVWGDNFLYVLTGAPSEAVREEVERVLVEFRHYCLRLVRIRAEKPESDFISLLLNAEENNIKLTLEEIADTIMLFVADGIENVASAVGSCVSTILNHFNAEELIYMESMQLKKIISECLRFETPGQFIARVALDEFSIRGQVIRKNDSVLLMLASANHDSEAYESPDKFNPNRKENWQLTFGRGKHSCLGARLVPMQLEEIMKVLFNSCHDMKLITSDLKWRTRVGHRWLEACNVSFNGKLF